MQNSTFLTDQYKDEDGIWSPCLLDFFKKHQKDPLFIPLHKRKETNRGPWYEMGHSEFSIKGEWASDAYGDKLLDTIAGFAKQQANGGSIRKVLETLRWVEKEGMRCDIAGIRPDFVFLPANGNVCYLVENKPFYGSGLTGNQIANGDYVNLANAINAQKQELGIELKIIFMHTVSWSKSGELIGIGKSVNGCVYSLLYESIFKAMAEQGFEYPLDKSGSPFGAWGQYTDLSMDV